MREDEPAPPPGGPPARPLRRELDSLVAGLYGDLHAAAARALRRERPGHTLQPTALLHEAFLRLAGQRQAGWATRAEFVAVAAATMRRVLVDHARARRAGKRGGDAARVTLSFEPESPGGSPTAAVDVLAMDELLGELATEDPRAARVVELRFFAGCSVEEAAAALGVSPPTVKRDWSFAKAWLWRALRRERADGGA